MSELVLDERLAPKGGSLTIRPDDPEIIWILGRTGLQTGPICSRLRKIGHVIPRHYEEEQAAFILWAIQLYQQHGAEWKARGDEILRGGEKQQ